MGYFELLLVKVYSYRVNFSIIAPQYRSLSLQATHTAGTPSVSIVTRAKRIEVSLSFMCVIADECTTLGLMVAFSRSYSVMLFDTGYFKIMFLFPVRKYYSIVMAMPIMSLCFSAHINNVLKISYIQFSKSNNHVSSERDKYSFIYL